MERREFLQSAMATATAAAAFDAMATPPPARPGVEWNKAPCRFCGTGCHLQVGVAEGRVVGVRGDQKAEVNKGLLCVKGYHAGMVLYGKDRLTKPLLRRDGELVEIEWAEALDVLAKRIMAKPEAFAYYGSGQWTIPEGYAAQKFMKGGLSNNHIEPNARLCMASAVTGFLGNYGVDEPAGCYDDLDAADVVILWGNNPAEMHPVLFSRIIDRRSKGEKVTLIDLGTRRTRSSEHADHVFLLKPQGDMAVANGIANLLVQRGTWNKEFVNKHCAFRKDADQAKPSLKGVASTFDEYKKSLARYTPAFVESVAGIKPKALELLADLFGKRELKITSLWCMGMNQHTRGTAINNLVHSVHLLSGHFGTPGDAPTSLTGQPSACGTAREVGTLAHALPGGRLVANEAHRTQSETIWNLPKGRINPKPGFHTVKMWQDFCAKDGAIRTIWVQVSNPGQSLPNIKELFENRPADSFLIVSDVYPTATTRLADLVLPSALWVEKNGMFGNSERRTQQWFKMVEPPGEARDDCWQTIAVAHRMMELGHPGMKDKDGHFLLGMRDADGKELPIWEWENYYTHNVDKALFEEYRAFSRLKHKDLAPYDEYVAARGLRWPVVQDADGKWNETRFRFTEGYDTYVKEGKGFEFYHSTSGDGRAQIWYRPWEPPPEVPDEQYPLWLCTGRVLEHWHTGSMTRRIPPLHRAMPNAYVEVNRADARRLGISDGEVVRVESRRGHCDLPVWLDGRGTPPEGSIFVPFFDENLLINRVTLEAHCPISKEPDYKKCAVRITRIS